MLKNTKHLTRSLSGALTALALAGSSGNVFAGKDSYTLQGTCAFLPADRAGRGFSLRVDY